MIRKIFYLLFLTGFVVWFPCVLFSEGMHISSSAVLLHGSPGEQLSGKFTVHADTDNPHEVTLEKNVKTWFLLDENRDVSLSSWLRVFPSRDITIPPGEEAKLQYRVTVPVDAQGYLMAMVTLQMLPYKPEEEVEDEEKENGDDEAVDDDINGEEQNTTDKPEKDDEAEAKSAELNPNELQKQEEKLMVYSIPIYLLVEGKTLIEYSIPQVQMSWHNEHISALVEIENTGNVFLKPAKILLTIYDDEGYEMTAVSLAAGWPVFPKQRHVYRGKQQYKQIDEGEYKATVTISGDYPAFEYTETRAFSVAEDGTIEIENPEKTEQKNEEKY